MNLLPSIGHSFTSENGSKRLRHAYTQYAGTVAPTLYDVGNPGDIFIVLSSIGSLTFPVAVYTRGTHCWTQWLNHNARPHHPDSRFQDRVLGISKPGTARRVFSWLPNRHDSHLGEYSSIEEEARDVLASVYLSSANATGHASNLPGSSNPVRQQVYTFRHLRPQDFDRADNRAQIDQEFVALTPVPNAPSWDNR
ncbi:hypothetical protein FA15DRAFT_665015 [Coprinopsis marcescibilis]|uniref:Uncharacterized protein n=1 Tax=Coprinopsis marcescibilis TaxID=230819 RepID=A0A5C3L6C8_COPMA|nr:hypothetical protein FA15DRAFT_665015 [Coprinopsis marcescibilis]